MSTSPLAARDRDAAFARPGTGPDAVLLLHGFTSGPRSMRPWADAVADAGYAVDLPLLPGHGTSWEDLGRTPWTAWTAAAERAFDGLQRSHDRVFVCGMSMGGALALHLASRRAPAGLVLANPALTFADRAARFAGILRHAVPSVSAIANDILLEGQDEGAYLRTPVAGVHQLGRLFKAARRGLPDVAAPVLVYRSAVDHVVPESSTAVLRAGLRGVRVEPLPNSYHVATLDHDAQTLFSGSIDFMRRIAAEGAASRG